MIVSKELPCTPRMEYYLHLDKLKLARGSKVAFRLKYGFISSSSFQTQLRYASHGHHEPFRSRH